MEERKFKEKEEKSKEKEEKVNNKKNQTTQMLRFHPIINY